MKTLDEHNKSRMQQSRLSTEPVKNGIVCPICGSELFDSNPQQVLASYPPKKDVHCQCGFHGYRVA